MEENRVLRNLLEEFEAVEERLERLKEMVIAEFAALTGEV